MIKVTLLYPNKEGSYFDAEYYCNTHTPMVTKLYGLLCKGVSVDIGIIPEVPNMLEQKKAFHAQEIMQDAKNYTDVEPIIQVSKITIS